MRCTFSKSPPHSFIHTSLTVLVIYVSCKQITSYFLCLIRLKTLLRFPFDLSPLTFKESSLRPEKAESPAIRKSVKHSANRQSSPEHNQAGLGGDHGLFRTCATCSTQLELFLHRVTTNRGIPFSPSLGSVGPRATLCKQGHPCLLDRFWFL